MTPKQMKLLVAVDGSPQSRAALDWGQRWANGGKHHLHAVTVVPPRSGVPGLGHPPLIEALHTNAERMMQEIARESPPGVSLTTQVLESLDIAGALLAEADRKKADLVAVGARGLSAIKTFFLGSISQRVTRHARRSVLIVRRPPPSGPLKITVAADGSASGAGALEFLKKLGVPPSSKVEAVHVVSTLFDVWGPEFGVPGGAFPTGVDKDVRSSLRKRGQRVLADAVSALRGPRVTVKSVMREGFPAQEVLAAARKHHADLLVVGARGLSGMDRFLLGSVSQKVSAYAEGSVLIVHGGKS